MRFTIITAFPDLFCGFLSESIVGRGLKTGLFEVKVLNLRDFGKGAYRQIDDYAFGAGGMVLMAQPLEEALNAARCEAPQTFVVYPTPQGLLLTQEIVETLFLQEHVVIVCGHYEGIDERFIEEEVDLEVTIGDCVLTGGEIPAMAIIDAVSRLIPGVVGKGEAVAEDSFYRGMLDHPHYTRPASWRGKDVPAVLLSGNAAAIRKWRREEAVARTLSRRPDLLSRSGLLEYMKGGFYLAIERAIEGEIEGEGDANEAGKEVREWTGLCEAYGVARLFLIADSQKRDAFRRAFYAETDAEIETETRCAGGFRGQDRIKLMPSLKYVMEWIKGKKDGRVLIVGVSDELKKGAKHWLELKRFILESRGSVLFYFASENNARGFGHCDTFMIPPREGRLSLLGKLAVILDRFL